MMKLRILPTLMMTLAIAGTTACGDGKSNGTPGAPNGAFDADGYPRNGKDQFDPDQNLRTPEQSEMEKIQPLAFQLQMDTNEAFEAAKADLESRRGGTPEEQANLQKLYKLKLMAEEFNAQLDDNSEDLAQTRLYWYELNRAFVVAQPVFVSFRIYSARQALFETIIDCVGNTRVYYIIPGRYSFFPYIDVYPYYPGHPQWRVFVATPVIYDYYYFRHPTYWHLHWDFYHVRPHCEHYISQFSFYFSWVNEYHTFGIAYHTHGVRTAPRPLLPRNHFGFYANVGRHETDLHLQMRYKERVRVQPLAPRVEGNTRELPPRMRRSAPPAPRGIQPGQGPRPAPGTGVSQRPVGQPGPVAGPRPGQGQGTPRMQPRSGQPQGPQGPAAGPRSGSRGTPPANPHQQQGQGSGRPGQPHKKPHQKG